MKAVMIYGFKARFSGTSEIEWNHPDIGATHKCLLFLAQDAESDDFQAAVAECRRYGLEEFENLRAGRLRVEVLNTDLYRGFSGFYEEALRSGSAVVYYPNDAASVATQPD
jgi:hypothetical protein